MVTDQDMGLVETNGEDTTELNVPGLLVLPEGDRGGESMEETSLAGDKLS